MLQIQERSGRFSPNFNNEAQTGDDWIKPVLRAMGHTFEVQAWLKTPDGAIRPDYFFYRDNAALLANKNKILDPDDLDQGAFPVAETKSWYRTLAKTIRGAST